MTFTEEVMRDDGTFGMRWGKYFHLKDVQSLTSRIGEASIAVTRLRSDASHLGMTEVIPAEDSYIIGVQIHNDPLGRQRSIARKPFTSAIWFDDRYIAPQRFEKTSVCFVHLERDARVDLQTPFDMVHFRIPRKSLSEIALDFGTAGSVDALRCPDLIITRLTGCLVPAFIGTKEVCAPLLDHISLALLAHLIQKYGEKKIPLQRSKESLAPWQIRRAKEFMASRISTSVSLAELAEECQLSVSHFARAFKGSVGVAPYRWFMEQKMEHAKRLLESTSLTTSTIAVKCGFSHHVSFSSSFQRTIGVSPREWRRARRASRRSRL